MIKVEKSCRYTFMPERTDRKVGIPCGYTFTPGKTGRVLPKMHGRKRKYIEVIMDYKPKDYTAFS